MPDTPAQRCPGCRASLVGSEAECPQCDLGLLWCRNETCRKVSAGYLDRCDACGSPLKGADVPPTGTATPRHAEPEPAMPRAIQHTPAPLPVQSAEPLSVEGPPTDRDVSREPLLRFLRHRRYRIGERAVLRFQAAFNPGEPTQAEFEFSNCDGFLASAVLSPARHFRDLDPVLYLPTRAGDDVVTIRVALIGRDRERQFFLGRVFLRVEPSPPPAAPITTHDAALIYNLVTPPAEEPIGPGTWEEVALKPDATRSSPTEAAATARGAGGWRELRRPGGAKVLVKFGARLTIGRSERMADWALRPLDRPVGPMPDETFARIGRKHVEVVLAEGKAWIETGYTKQVTLLNGVYLPPEGRTELPDGSTISLGAVFDLVVRHQSDDRGVSAIIIARGDDPTGRRLYVLVPESLDLAWLGARGRVTAAGVAGPRRDDTEGTSWGAGGGPIAARSVERRFGGELLGVSSPGFEVVPPCMCGSCGRSIVPAPDAQNCPVCHQYCPGEETA